MDSTSSSLKRGRGEACLQCREARRKCHYEDEKTCARCAGRGFQCSQAAGMQVRRAEKRKSEDLETLSESDTCQIDRAPSSITVSHSPEDMPNGRVQKNTRSMIRSKSESTQPSHPNSYKEHSNSVCDICRRNQTLRKRVAEEDMVQCEIEACGRWYHFTCLWYDKKQHILVQRSAKQDNLFICAMCNKKSEAQASDCVAEADTQVTEMIKRVKENLTPRNDHEMEIPNSPRTEISTPEASPHANSMHGLDIAQWGNDGALGTSNFVPAKSEKFQGFDESVLHHLIRKITQAVFDYDKEMCDMIRIFEPSNYESLHYPLKVWNLIDSAASTIEGQEWYHHEGNGNFNGHAPITASLRSMTQTATGKPIIIRPKLQALKFSQVHRAFVYRFIIDVVANNFDIFSLPNMKPVRAMMAGVYDFGDERWREMGKHVLREVQLRTWHKNMFQGEMLQNKQHLMRRFELYMEPLTKNFKQWSFHRNDIIEHTIQLWSYLDALGGMFDVNEPKLGSAFDPELHEGFDEEGLPFIPDAHSEKTILWVIRRGFRYRENSVDGPREFSVKAIVIVH